MTYVFYKLGYKGGLGKGGGGGLGWAGRVEAGFVLFVLFALCFWSLGQLFVFFLPELNIGSTNVLLLLRWPKAV